MLYGYSGVSLLPTKSAWIRIFIQADFGVHNSVDPKSSDSTGHIGIETVNGFGFERSISIANFEPIRLTVKSR